MSHYCEFVVGASGDPSGNPVVNVCDAPASIRHHGRWYCADHYDSVIDYSILPLIDSDALRPEN